MSLLKNKPSSFGAINTTYWKICQFNYDVVEDIIVAIICGYLDENAKSDKATPLDQETRIWKIKELTPHPIGNLTVDQIKTRLYEKIKEPVFVDGVNTNFFADAKDV